MLDATNTRTALTVPISEMLAACALFGRVIEKRNGIPILANICFAGDGTATATATDMDIEAVWTFPAADQHTPFTVSFAALQASLKGADKGGLITLEPQMTVDDEDAGEIVITADGLVSTVPTIPVVDFPHLTLDDRAGLSWLCPAKAFRDWAGFIAPAISTEETRYYLNGIYLHPARGTLHGVATDGHRLALRTLGKAWEGEQGAGTIWPAKAVKVALATLGTKPLGDVLLEATPTRVTVSWGPCVIRTRAVDGPFPDYTRVIPQQDSAAVAVMDVQDTLKAVTRLLGVTSERASPLALDASLQSIRCTSDDGKHSIPVKFSGLKDGVVGINGNYLKDCLTTFKADGADTVRVQMTGAGKPLRITSDDTFGQYVIMPMKVQ